MSDLVESFDEDIANSTALQLSTSGLSFSSPATEADYRVWLYREAIPHTRAAVFLVLAILLVALWCIRTALPPRFFSPAAALILGLGFPLAFAGLATTYRPGLIRWMFPVRVITIAVLDLTLAGTLAAAGLPQAAVIGTIVICFYSFTVPRFPALLGFVAMLPLAVIAQFSLLGPWLFTPVSGAEAIFGSLGLWTAFALGTLACLIIDRVSHETFRQQRIIEAQKISIDRERERADNLLNSILPTPIAKRLKLERAVIADGFDAVTVLFADIVGFTPLSERMTPRDLVALLNEVFSAFDEMARRHGLEKIKTIGDAYMVVGGLPEPRADHAAAVAAMALEMHGAVGRIGDGRISLRIGIHSGPAVAGVIGTSKYSYDLWGDTVNTASRMESHGAPGEIHVTDAFRAALDGRFILEERGRVEIKGKGPMHTWWLKRAAQGAIP